MDWKAMDRRKALAKVISLGRIERGMVEVDTILKSIMDYWYEAGHEVGDKGSCVIGEGMFFNYKGEDYWMMPNTGWQGEGSWTPFVPAIKEMLKAAGATDIDWNCGRLD